MKKLKLSTLKAGLIYDTELLSYYGKDIIDMKNRNRWLNNPRNKFITTAKKNLYLSQFQIVCKAILNGRLHYTTNFYFE